MAFNKGFLHLDRLIEYGHKFDAAFYRITTFKVFLCFVTLGISIRWRCAEICYTECCLCWVSHFYCCSECHLRWVSHFYCNAEFHLCWVSRSLLLCWLSLMLIVLFFIIMLNLIYADCHIFIVIIFVIV